MILLFLCICVCIESTYCITASLCFYTFLYCFVFIKVSTFWCGLRLQDVYNMQQQPSSQPHPTAVVLPQQRSSMSRTTTNTSPSPAQSPYSNLQSPVAQQTATMLNQHLVQHIGNNSVAPTRSPAPGGAQTGGTITAGGALTPAPSPSPQTRTAASPVIRSSTPQPTVIHQVWLCLWNFSWC